MSINKKIIRKSDAVQFLETITGGELTFGRLLHSIRMCEGMELAEFSALLDISREQLCDIEKDRRNISPLKAIKWAKKLGYPAEQFLSLALETSLHKNGIYYKVNVIAC